MFVQIYPTDTPPKNAKRDASQLRALSRAIIGVIFSTDFAMQSA